MKQLCYGEANSVVAGIGWFYILALFLSRTTDCDANQFQTLTPARLVPPIVRLVCVRQGSKTKRGALENNYRNFTKWLVPNKVHSKKHQERFYHILSACSQNTVTL